MDGPDLSIFSGKPGQGYSVRRKLNPLMTFPNHIFSAICSFPEPAKCNNNVTAVYSLSLMIIFERYWESHIAKGCEEQGRKSLSLTEKRPAETSLAAFASIYSAISLFMSTVSLAT